MLENQDLVISKLFTTCNCSYSQKSVGRGTYPFATTSTNLKMAVAAYITTSPLKKLYNPSNIQEIVFIKLFSTAAVHCSGHRLTLPSLALFPGCQKIARDRFISEASSSSDDIPVTTVKIVAVVGEGRLSPLKGATWEEVMLHTAERLKWVDEEFQMSVFTDKSIKLNEANLEKLSRQLTDCNIFMAVALNDPVSLHWLQRNTDNIPNRICFESSPSLTNKLGGSFGESREVAKTVTGAWARYNSDDIRFCILVIINYCIKPVTALKNLRAKGLSTVNCMMKKCGAQVLNCLLDSNCRKALQCLNRCSPTDQVCNYRCIASYESPALEAFSLCVLQRHNCLDLAAEIPTKPEVPPLSVFRGEAVNHETAEDLFVGWLGVSEWSWRVVAGQNPAYDQFPCQYQLFYRGRAKGSFWYEPVFQVKTLEEEKLVWRRRRYRVRRGRIPGTFYFSVLDNGVVSKEFWTVVEVSDDLSWGLFHYSGAAEAAGICYTGAVLVSPDGMYPRNNGGEKLAAAIERCGVKEWELYLVDNCSCFNPPLGIPAGSGLHQSIDIRDERWMSAG